MSLLFSIISLFWSGMIFGLSFIATPAKFLAEGLTLPVAVSIGNVTFHIFTKIEWVAFAVLTFLVYCFKLSRITRWIFIIILVCLLLQTFWLLPVLDNNVILRVDGKTPPETIHHWIYIISETIKLFTLLLGGIWLLYKENKHV